MTAATETAVGPISEWADKDSDEDAINGYTTKAAAAGSVAWAVLTHSQGLGPDIARMIGPMSRRRSLPKGMDSEDIYGFLWDLVGEAAEIGYVMAQIETSGFDRQWPGARLRTSDLARAIAALLRTDLIEDGQTFDPEWRTKLHEPVGGKAVAA